MRGGHTFDVFQAEGNGSLDLFFLRRQTGLRRLARAGSMGGIIPPIGKLPAKFEAGGVAPKFLALLHAFPPVAGLLSEVDVVADDTQWLQIYARSSRKLSKTIRFLLVSILVMLS